MGDILYSYKDGFSKGFKRARKAAGYTQQKFALAFGYATIETIRNWEQGRNIPEIDTIEKLCAFFNCDMDYLFGKIDYKTHNTEYICKTIGLSEKAVEMLILIYNESVDDLPYGSYAFGKNPEHKIIGAGKTRRVINELLESEYDRFIAKSQTGSMDNLFSAIDEYFHPFDFAFCIYDKKDKQITRGGCEPLVLDRADKTYTLIDEEEIYRSVIKSRITHMLSNRKYNMAE